MTGVTGLNPIMGELLHFLQEQGFDVFAVPPNPTDDELKSWQKERSFEVISVGEIQERVESIYLYAAFRSAPPDAFTETPTPMGTVERAFEDQVGIAERFLQDNGLQPSRLEIDKAKKTLNLDISKTAVTDLTPLAGMSSLQSLNLYRTQVTDLTPLAGLSSLKTLSIPDNFPIEKSNLILFDVSGKEISKSKINSRSHKIERGNLSAGIYLYKIVDDGEIISVGKFVVE